MLGNSVRFKSYTIFIISIFLFSCNLDNNNDVAISNLEDRLVELNNQISSLNLDINRLDSIITNQLTIIELLSDSTFTMIDSNSDSNAIESDDLIEEQDINTINPEELFKEKFSISSLSVLTCTLRDINKNKVARFYKEDLIEIANNDMVEQYLILEINKLKKFIKVKSVNYDIEFFVYMDSAQE